MYAATAAFGVGVVFLVVGAVALGASRLTPTLPPGDLKRVPWWLVCLLGVLHYGLRAAALCCSVLACLAFLRPLRYLWYNL